MEESFLPTISSAQEPIKSNAKLLSWQIAQNKLILSTKHYPSERPITSSIFCLQLGYGLHGHCCGALREAAMQKWQMRLQIFSHKVSEIFHSFVHHKDKVVFLFWNPSSYECFSSERCCSFHISELHKPQGILVKTFVQITDDRNIAVERDNR